MRVQARTAFVHSAMLAGACAVSYLVTTRVLSHVHQISPHDSLVGGMWAMIATAFVYRLNYEQSLAAAFTRVLATVLSFALCFVYLLFLPFSVLGTALLIGLGAFALLIIGRPNDVITATVTTSVVMVLAAVSPHDAWEQPVLRLADTIVGIAVGIVVSWLGLQFTKIGRSFERERLGPSPEGSPD